ncbi:MAG: hypothetical protein ACE5GX_07830 [Thermoanaerobaculia bacterium]
MRRTPAIIMALAALPTAISGQEAELVEVVNLPEVQTIAGTVEVEGPVVQTRLVSLSEAIVPPVQPAETTALVDLGTLDVFGFSEVVLSLAGEVKSDFFAAGVVGALLVPDQPLASKAFAEARQLLFPLRLEAAADANEIGPYFSSQSPPIRVGFPRYRVYLFNTTDRAAAVTLYAYLGN